MRVSSPVQLGMVRFLAITVALTRARQAEKLHAEIDGRGCQPKHARNLGISMPGSQKRHQIGLRRVPINPRAHQVFTDEYLALPDPSAYPPLQSSLLPDRPVQTTIRLRHLNMEGKVSEYKLSEEERKALGEALTIKPNSQMNIKILAHLMVLEGAIAALVNMEEPNVIDRVKEVLKQGAEAFDAFNGKLPSGESIAEEMSAELTSATQNLIKRIDSFPSDGMWRNPAAPDQSQK